MARNCSRNLTLAELPPRPEAVARLWPQTERLRAALALAAEGVSGARSEAALAFDAVWRFIETAPPGLYRDALDGRGALDVGPAKASSLHHIAGAFLAFGSLARDAGGTPRRLPGLLS